MLHLALEPIDRNGFSSLNDYQFVSQGILCLLPLLYIVACRLKVGISESERPSIARQRLL
jgi:hypothetical protein